MMPIPYKPTTLTGLLILALAMTLSGCIKTPTDPGTNPPPNNDPNILSLSSASGAPGDTGIIVNVNLHNIVPIAGVQLKISYDSTRLQPSSPEYIKPARASQMGLYAGTFTTPGLIIFGMSWFPPNPGQIDIGDGPILQLRFDVKSTASAGTSLIQFWDDGNPNTVENGLSDTSGVLIFPQLQNGSFFVQ